MDTAGLIVLPRAEDPIDADLREVDVAIALVAQGAAVRVRLVGLASADRIAPFALAHAQSPASTSASTVPARRRA
jgi:hypothetical protein